MVRLSRPHWEVGRPSLAQTPLLECRPTRDWPGVRMPCVSTGALRSWRDGDARAAIVGFVERVTGDDGSSAVPVEDRVAVFDNDGTLWCEKPMPIQLDFILRRLVDMAEAKPELHERQPWKAAHERDYGRFGAAMTEHYTGTTPMCGPWQQAFGCPWRDHRRRFRGAGKQLPSQHGPSDARSRVPAMCLRADGRAAPLLGGQRFLEVVSMRNDWTTVFRARLSATAVGTVWRDTLVALCPMRTIRYVVRFRAEEALSWEIDDESQDEIGFVPTR